MLTTPGIGRNDIWIFETATRAPVPREIFTLFPDSPRALAVSANGEKLFVAALLSGNRTTVLAPAGINKALPNETTEGLVQPDTQMFTDFIMELSYPPNPIRNLDNSLTEDQTAGRQLYNNGVVRVQTGIREVCRTCHPVSPGAGLFGTRGFSYNHNGATTSNFIIADLGMPSTDLRQLRSFLFAFPTESPPILGQQVIVTSTSNSANNARLSLLIERAGTTLPIPECDLIAKGVIDDKQRGWLLDVDGLFIPDNSSESPITEQQLLAFASADSPLTFTCVPWGSGIRMGIDRDLDGILGGDE